MQADSASKTRAAGDVPMRFAVVTIKDGPSLVLDLAAGRRIVASCFDLPAAETFAALMNGDVRAALARREAAVASPVSVSGRRPSASVQTPQP